MKLRYKKLVIIISVATLALAFFILTLIPTGGTEPHSAENAELMLNEKEEINTLIASYYEAKKNVDFDTLSTLVSDPNQIPKEKFITFATYVEDYQNINCYVIENEGVDAYRVYVRYDMKLKNIQTLVPCLAAFYVTVASDGRYVVYFSAFDEEQEDFIASADRNQEIIDLKEEVADKLQEAIDSDESFKQFYQKMDTEIQSASGTAVTD